MSYADSVEYATPAPRPGARVWAGAAIVLAGLVLIVLGGCFLIGVMLTVSNGFSMAGAGALTGNQLGLVFILYALAFLSFGGALWLLFVGVRGLLHVMRG
ncbi:MAG TPA: hypothetical protein VGR35_02785 [Tepidisphaeraceae bacterium]|nr:hypothetical protein [Tepidisphaeraceae bacterium]